MTRLPEPHAGVLVDLHVHADRAAELRDRAARLPRISLDAREAADLDLLASGAASPLSGFMGVHDYRSVLDRLRLANGTPWPIPVTLAVTIEQMAGALRHGAAALGDARGRLRAVLDVTDAFVRDPREEARALYGTDDPDHVGVAKLLSRPTGTLGGRITALRPSAPLGGAALGPRDVRSLARRERWTAIAALATVDGASCLEPSGGAAPALLPILPVAVRHAAGRDAFLLAIVLKNYGAREVLFEHDRADWLEVSPELLPQDLGITPTWVRCPAPRAVQHRRTTASRRDSAEPHPPEA
ncbi:sulfate adenylyltransferase [Anaeromyxobacter sp. Fw109-5]|uniref:sulfate adenylyltransferase n=1 Tax=Anaeromyxobacter sp. (strain Fw109-5) TaxID=404589 RepID=UPI0000ED6E5F|nr:sulfate adenylyltransferase [Anaeromyxobacter sp. Fw109-5]ABS28581.1 Sulfate adenylyltransferase [Anaeromyxobacter sp. Fw109-5]